MRNLLYCVIGILLASLFGKCNYPRVTKFSVVENHRIYDIKKVQNTIIDSTQDGYVLRIILGKKTGYYSFEKLKDGKVIESGKHSKRCLVSDTNFIETLNGVRKERIRYYRPCD